MNKKSITYQNHLLKLMKKHGTPEITVREWNSIAQSKGLPLAYKYIQSFGAFSEMKKRLGWETRTIKSSNRKPYTKSEIESIFRENRDLFSKSDSDDMMRIWEDYRKNHPNMRLPTYKTVSHHTTYDERLDYIQSKKKRYNLREKESLKKLALTHSGKFSTSRVWDQWALTNDLPTSDKYIYLFDSWEQAKKEIFGQTSKEHLQHKLIDVGVTHYEHMTTTKAWNSYAADNNLPPAHKFIYQFESWKKAKEIICSTIKKFD